MNAFFSTNKFVKDIDVRFSNQIQNSYELSAYIEKTFTKYYGDLLKKIKYRLLGEDAKNRKVKCIPFSNRTYIRASGKVQFCERIENMGITSLDTDDMKSTANIHLKNYQDFIEENCNKCFAYNYCEMCFASFVTNSKLDKNKANNKCKNFQNEIKIAFEIYIDLMETDEKLLEQF